MRDESPGGGAGETDGAAYPPPVDRLLTFGDARGHS